MRRHVLVGALIMSTFAFAAASCGDEGPGEPSEPDPQNPTPSPHSSYSASCCLNGTFYDCASQEAFDLCAGFDVFACQETCAFTDSKCMSDCAQKASTAKHDPSQCTRNPAKDGTCNTTSPSPSPSGSCVGSHNGMACSYSTQCPSGYHCSKGKCYSDGIGNPCEYSTQCSSSNCTDGCCRGTSKGSPCTYSTQCQSGNCTNGRCQ